MSELERDSLLPLRDLDRDHQHDAAQPALPANGILRGVKVSLKFALKLADGQVVDSNFDATPVSFVIGDGNMLPGFELALMGRQAGDRIDAVIPAARAFGAVNPDNQQRFPRYLFPPDLAVSENLLVEFADASGYKQAGRVVHIGMHDIEIDFNHPLAGKDILFCAEIHSIEPAAVRTP